METLEMGEVASEGNEKESEDSLENGIKFLLDDEEVMLIMKKNNQKKDQ